MKRKKDLFCNRVLSLHKDLADTRYELSVIANDRKALEDTLATRIKLLSEERIEKEDLKASLNISVAKQDDLKMALNQEKEKVEIMKGKKELVSNRVLTLHKELAGAKSEIDMYKHEKKELSVKLVGLEKKLNLTCDKLHQSELRIDNIKKSCLRKIIENEQLEERLSMLSSENVTLKMELEAAAVKTADLEVKLMREINKVIERKKQSDVKIDLLNCKLDNVSELLHRKQRKLKRKNFITRLFRK